jgi:hypothetical protein
MQCGQRISGCCEGGEVFEELLNLLCRLGLGPAAKPACDLIARLAGETMSLQQLQQEIRNVLTHHGRAHLTATVVSTLVELGLAGYAQGSDEENEDTAAAAALRAARTGSSPISDSVLLTDTGNSIAVNPRATRAIHDTARGWLDIDGGIYFDVRQHGAGSDSEK